MRTTSSRQACILIAIVFGIGCDGINSGPGAVGGGSGTLGGTTSASSTKGTNSTNSTGGKSNPGQNSGTGSTVGTTTATSGGDSSSGGSLENRGGSNQGGNNQGGSSMGGSSLGASSNNLTGGRTSSGGSSASSGGTGRGGSSAVTTGAGGSSSTAGGSISRGGATTAVGGATIAAGGNTARTTSATGGVATGGVATGGVATGGVATGGAATGGAATGGVTATGGATNSSSTAAIDCNAAMPTGGTAHQSSNASGTAAGLTWTIWTNSGPGTITTFSVPAFSASWNGSGDFLARIGLQWNNTKTYDQYGTILAQIAFKKSGTGGGYSYFGIYGWSTNPCVEYYIVDDSYNNMPVNPGNTTNKGTADIDGGTYTLYTRQTSGTGGSKCSGVTSWVQYYSIRKTARQCGVISISQHFDAWAKVGMPLGKMDQAQILVETGGGTGSVDFSTANVTTTQ